MTTKKLYILLAVLIVLAGVLTVVMFRKQSVTPATPSVSQKDTTVSEANTDVQVDTDVEDPVTDDKDVESDYDYLMASDYTCAHLMAANLDTLQNAVGDYNIDFKDPTVLSESMAFYQFYVDDELWCLECTVNEDTGEFSYQIYDASELHD